MPYQATSRAAYDTANLPRREAQVFCALRDHGPAARGLLDVELARLTGLPINVITGARNGLVDKGLVRDSGRRRVNPGSGKLSIIWELGKPDVLQEQPRQPSLF